MEHQDPRRRQGTQLRQKFGTWGPNHDHVLKVFQLVQGGREKAIKDIWKFSPHLNFIF